MYDIKERQEKLGTEPNFLGIFDGVMRLYAPPPQLETALQLIFIYEIFTVKIILNHLLLGEDPF